MVERYRLEGARELPTYFEAWRGDLTQQQVADAMGTSKQTVSRIETGAREWGKGYLEGFAKVIGCHPLAPLLSPPIDGFDVSAALLSLEQAGRADPRNLRNAATSLRSLGRQEEQVPNPAAKPALKTKA